MIDTNFKRCKSGKEIVLGRSYFIKPINSQKFTTSTFSQPLRTHASREAIPLDFFLMTYAR